MQQSGSLTVQTLLHSRNLQRFLVVYTPPASLSLLLTQLLELNRLCSAHFHLLVCSGTMFTFVPLWIHVGFGLIIHLHQCINLHFIQIKTFPPHDGVVAASGTAFRGTFLRYLQTVIKPFYKAEFLSRWCSVELIKICFQKTSRVHLTVKTNVTGALHPAVSTFLAEQLENHITFP